MQSHKSNIRIDLLLLLVGIILLNVGFTYILSDSVVESDIEKLDKHISQVESDEIHITKEGYIKTIEGVKNFTIASDKTLDLFQKSIGYLAIANILLVALMVAWLIRKDNERNK